MTFLLPNQQYINITGSLNKKVKHKYSEKLAKQKEAGKYYTVP